MNSVADLIRRAAHRARAVSTTTALIFCALVYAGSTVVTQFQIRDSQHQFREGQLASAERGKDIQSTLHILQDATSPEAKARSDENLRLAIQQIVAAVDCHTRAAIHDGIDRTNPGLIDRNDPAFKACG